ncbi:hypothetical protein GOP47_0018612 [Adiantum capillus-veneris]|uniref:BHLH domain-containing protein n=1 Tax=Adiantum capillus-veneris TaxID=13818 RepID=A0A9D4UEH1_ADICA|nr:hypothetical protein GOP47_0018612 [Adiantum capillus-veneris]
MDDIFDQMLSTSPWGDGVGANRQASWDTMAPGPASNSVAMESTAGLQALHKASPNNMQQLMGGGLESQGVLARAMQQGNVPLTSELILDTGQGHGLPVPHHSLQSMAPTWYTGGMPQALHGMSLGDPEAYARQGADVIPQDYHYGKRPRPDEDSLSLDGLSRNLQLAHLAASEEMKSLQSFGDQAALGQDPSGGAVKPRVRARRGQATDPHSIAERNRRERIAERMKALQELVPDSNKTDKASMLDEIIGYVKFLQMQVKCLSMCRLGGTGAAGPLLADLPVEGASSFLAANLNQPGMSGGGSSTSQEGMAFAERQVARLMDEDMSAAMQYLQSKGLCLMPISLATAISSTGSRQPPSNLAGAEGAAAGNMKQAMELQVAAMAAAATVQGGSVLAAPFSCNPKSQGGGSGKVVHTNVARSLMPNLQRDDKSKLADHKAALPPPPLNK